jgi:hypothetical protein
MREAAPSQGGSRCPRWLAAATVLQGIAATVLLLLVIQPTTVVVQSLQPTALPQGFAALISPSGPAVTEPQAQMRGPPAAAAQSEHPAAADAAAKRYAYGVEAPLELPSPPPPEPAMPAASTAAGCSADRRYDRYLASRQWTAAEMAVVKGIVNASTPTAKPATFHGYVCYQHRNVSDDPPRRGCANTGGAGAARRSERCRAREPTFPTPAGTCLCCPMKGHVCPPCWGCLMPLSRRRAFGGKLYRRRAVER